MAFALDKVLKPFLDAPNNPGSDGSRGWRRAVGIALFGLFTGGLVLAIVAGSVRQIQTNRARRGARQRGRCPRCGQDLGGRRDRCPACGGLIPDEPARFAA